MKNIVLCFFALCISFISNAQNDSLTIVWQGQFNNERYRIYYRGSLLREIKPGNFNYEMKIPIDSTFIKDKAMHLEYYRKGSCGLFYRNTFCGEFFNPDKKYLIIHRNTKLKRRYAIEALWSDDLIYFR